MTALSPPDAGRVAEWVRAALAEDAALDDATVAFLGLGERPVVGEIRAGAEVVVSGIDVAGEVFRQVDPRCRLDACARDGEGVVDGGVVCRISGPARAIVSGERTALNFLAHMSGVATAAARFVAAVQGTGVVILDTRKTTPFLRELEKYAVRCGGARNHRPNLESMVLVKDNHVRVMGGYRELVAFLRRHTARRPPFVEVEVDSIEVLREVLQAPIDRVMLDNFTPAAVAEALGAVAAFRDSKPGVRLEVEVSGGVTLDSVRAYAQRGVDFISVGAITQSSPAAPMSLDVL